jgi:hypothetical protein
VSSIASLVVSGDDTRNSAAPSLTVGDVRWLHAQTVLVACRACPYQQVTNVEALPDSLPRSVRRTHSGYFLAGIALARLRPATESSFLYLLLHKPSRSPSTQYRRHRLGRRKVKAMKLAMIAASPAVQSSLHCSCQQHSPIPCRNRSQSGRADHVRSDGHRADRIACRREARKMRSRSRQNGTCPWGWLASGSFCLRSGR